MYIINCFLDDFSYRGWPMVLIPIPNFLNSSNYYFIVGFVNWNLSFCWSSESRIFRFLVPWYSIFSSFNWLFPISFPTICVFTGSLLFSYVLVNICKVNLSSCLSYGLSGFNKMFLNRWTSICNLEHYVLTLSFSCTTLQIFWLCRIFTLS